MIVIDQLADIKLTQRLEALRAEPDASRIIYFPLANKPSIAGIKEKILEAAQKHIFSTNLQIYLCEDGDIFLLAPNIPTKEGNLFILEMASFAKIPAGENFAQLYEVSVHINKLLLVLEQKELKRRKAEEAIKQEQEKHRAERKRQEILSGKTLGQLGDFAKIRAERENAQIMIIEDDAFSRRLVENVVKSQYQLTALETADLALATYAKIAPDILFLDINLPDVTGHELLEKIIAIDPKAYVIMLSGNADKDNILNAINKGAKGFIGKPFNRDKLFQYIDRCPTIKQSQAVNA